MDSLSFLAGAGGITSALSGQASPFPADFGLLNFCSTFKIISALVSMPLMRMVVIRLNSLIKYIQKMGAKGETKLSRLIKNMEPHLNEGEYVFASLKNIDNVPREVTICEFKEAEGTTIVIERYQADKLNLSYDFAASWITLRIHSSLEAVGLTAAFSSELANNGISCNVVAGYFHDHIFVDRKNGQKTIEILRAMITAKV